MCVPLSRNQLIINPQPTPSTPQPSQPQPFIRYLNVIGPKKGCKKKQNTNDMVVIQVRAALLRLMWAQLGSQSPPTATFPRDGFCFLRSFARYCAGRGGDSGGFGYGVRFPLLHLHVYVLFVHCLLYTSPSPRDATLSRMPSSA